MEPLFHHHIIDKLAFANGLLSGVALFPQVGVLFAGGSLEGVSGISFLIIFINSGVWLVYAIHRQLISLAVASVLNMCASGLLVLGTILLSI